MEAGWSWRIVIAVLAIAAASLHSLAEPRPAAAKGLEFRQCHRPGHEAFECATMRVPLKLSVGRPRAGSTAARKASPRRIGIHVERLKRSRDNDGLLLALAGGPGQAATDFAAENADSLKPAWKGSRQFVTIDQRGTGKSGYLDCDLEQADGRLTVAFSRCSRQLGGAARWYRTADSVADIQRLRHLLGVRKLTVFGVSYGTVVAGQYARTYPERTEGLILDSVFSGWDPLLRPSYAASARVLEAFCADGACDGITADPVADTAELVRRVGAGIEGRAVQPRKRDKRRVKLNPGTLAETLLATDLNAPARSLWPGALAAADAGDLAPISRLVSLLGGSGATAPDPGQISLPLNLATNCADTPNPWRGRTPIPIRKQRTGDLILEQPAAAWGPFNARAAYSTGLATNCFGWRFGPQTGALTDEPLPDVPALLLEGEEDLRTPISTMEAIAGELPQAAVTVIANQGHSVLDAKCAQSSLAAWIAGKSVAGACEEPITYPMRPTPPRSLAELAGSTTPERTLEAVRSTVFEDALPFTDLLLNAGQSDGGGVRAGFLSAEPGDRFVIRLRRYSLVPGVKVSGKLVIAGSRASGQFRVSGGAAAAGELRYANQRLVGTLGGQHFDEPSSPRELELLRSERPDGPPPGIALP